MPQTALTLRHDDGTIDDGTIDDGTIDDGTISEQIFDLQGDLDTLDGIDEAIEQFKNAVLPQVEQQRLGQAQERVIAQEKKQSLIANGSDQVTLRTRHGAFVMVRRRFRNADGQEVKLFSDTLSNPLRHTCLFWAGRLSFGEVARLVAERCGIPLLSEDSLWRLVQTEALRLDAAQQQQIADCASLPEPSYGADTDLYDAQV